MESVPQDLTPEAYLERYWTRHASTISLKYIATFSVEARKSDRIKDCSFELVLSAAMIPDTNGTAIV